MEVKYTANRKLANALYRAIKAVVEKDSEDEIRFGHATDRRDFYDRLADKLIDELKEENGMYLENAINEKVVLNYTDVVLKDNGATMPLRGDGNDLYLDIQKVIRDYFGEGLVTKTIKEK